ncbi:hypothetical protein [Desulfosediminicola flagellatus]|uniref:hypothetical protein n=1 Tax=Desulfosediminicola flagellatus TaxID=2569541 RepID=UPI0010AD34E7|nr:hypothetical protein [Desulfosediminicola flagellatus]
MGQQKLKNSNVKEHLIIVFVLIGSLLIITDVGRNISDEIRLVTELKSLTNELTSQPQSPIQSTLSDEEMKQWTERLKKHSDT